MGRFSGKKIVITGASSGIGLAGAMRIIDEGGEVMLTRRHQQIWRRYAHCCPSAPGFFRTMARNLRRRMPSPSL